MMPWPLHCKIRRVGPPKKGTSQSIPLKHIENGCLCKTRLYHKAAETGNMARSETNCWKDVLTIRWVGAGTERGMSPWRRWRGRLQRIIRPAAFRRIHLSYYLLLPETDDTPWTTGRNKVFTANNFLSS